MDAFFFRVDHDLLRSESFKSLGGSAIKVYLVIGFYSDFGTDWAYPSVRTIARQAGLSRQTVLTAIEELVRAGVLAASKVRGKSNAYKIIRHAPRRPEAKKGQGAKNQDTTGPSFLGDRVRTGLDSLEVGFPSGPNFFDVPAQSVGPMGPTDGPKREPETRGTDSSTSIPIPGTPFRLSAEGRLLVAVDLQNLLTDQGIPRQLASKLAAQKDPEAVAKVLLNALYLQSQGKLQNGPGYIRTGIEEGYELLPQVANRLEVRRRELQEQLRTITRQQEQKRNAAARSSEEEAVRLMFESLGPDELQRLVDQAVAPLPEPLVRRNPTLTNPFVRTKVYELAGGEPVD